jgi:eukaryotic-like serine/threonine-protein kinase
MVWKPGDLLQGGKYKVESVLGRGSFGITYLVKNGKGDRAVIKTLDDPHLSTQAFKRLQSRFVTEAFKLAKCQHPHIVRLLADPFQEPAPSQNLDLWCIAMEYIAGTTLDNRDNQILSESEALNYIKQIGEALIVVHQNQLVHNDVRPGNIMIRAGSAKAVLIDFGLAREGDRTLSVNSVATATEPNYAPIELYSDKIPLQPYTDVYSLAATLYNLLTGKLPETAQNRKLNNQPLIPPQQHNPQISKKVNRAILQGMELDPENRPQSVQEWLDALGIAIDSNPPNPSVDLQTELAHKGLRLNQIQVIIALLGLIITILAAWQPLRDILEKVINPVSTPTLNKPTPTTTK